MVQRYVREEEWHHGVIMILEIFSQRATHGIRCVTVPFVLFFAKEECALPSTAINITHCFRAAKWVVKPLLVCWMALVEGISVHLLLRCSLLRRYFVLIYQGFPFFAILIIQFTSLCLT